MEPKKTESMISVKASLLESIRTDPEAYGRLLASGNEKTSGGSHGMFACWVDVVRAIHTGKLSDRQAIRELHSKFLRFKDIPANKDRQERLIESMVAYLQQYKKFKYEWVDGSRRIQWGLTDNVMLTGLTPWVVQNEIGYVSYLMAEHTFDWRSQLRFPLYQQYLSKHTIECNPDELQIGFYFADKDRFDLTTFSKSALKLAVDETGVLFNTLYQEFEKKKYRR